MSSAPRSADRVFDAESSDRVDFSDLSERQSVKLGAMTRYVARSHFQTWEQLRKMPDFDSLSGIFTPLVSLEIEATDAKVRPGEILTARGQSAFGKVLTTSGAVRQITRDGRHELFGEQGDSLGAVRFVNVFTRYDKDPEKRKIVEIPEELGVGRLPDRVTDLSTVEDLIERKRTPDFHDSRGGVWQYEQTDPNRHVNSLAYLSVLQEFSLTELFHAGLSMDRLWVRRAKVVFRKPCFRGEGYRCSVWQMGADPQVLGAAIFKVGDPAGHPPAAAASFTLATHAD